MTSRKRSSIAEKIDQFHNERRKSTHQIEEKPRKKSHDEKEEVKEVPKLGLKVLGFFLFFDLQFYFHNSKSKQNSSSFRSQKHRKSRNYH